MTTLILTGWGWKEYAVAASVVLKALNGHAEVRGMSKRHLPEFLAAEGEKWKRIYLIGISLGGDEKLLAETLKRLGRKTEVIWISGLNMSDSQRKDIAPLLKVMRFEGGYFNGSLVKAVGKAFKVDVSAIVPYAIEKNKIPKTVPPYHELISAAMYVHRCYQDERPYEIAIQYLAAGVAGAAWSPEMKRLVAKHREMNAGLMGSDEPAKGGIIPDELEQVIKNHIKNVFYKYAQNLSRASAAPKISRNTMRKYLEEARAEEA